MHAPSFWWRAPGTSAFCLSPIAALYGAVASLRLKQPGADAGLPVICIGNPTVGGAGKTPTALAVARLMLTAGKRPVFLTRGYGGRLTGPAQVDLSSHNAGDVGDESLLLARLAPTIVSRDRVKGAYAAQHTGAGVIIMDDGFQNPSLNKQLSILVVDGRRGIGNGRVIPAGPLRAPLKRQLDHAHALLIIGSASNNVEIIEAARAKHLKIFYGHLEPDAVTKTALAGRKVLAFSGIGDPEKFFATVRACRIEAPICLAFPDHHRYTASEAASLLTEADRHGLILLTTEKDQVRLNGDKTIEALAARTQSLPVALIMEQPHEFRQFVLDALALR